MSIRSSTVANRCAAVMTRSGSVDETCKHGRSIVRHRFLLDFFPIPTHPDAAQFFSHLAQIEMNRGQNRDCATGA